MESDMSIRVEIELKDRIWLDSYVKFVIAKPSVSNFIFFYNLKSNQFS